MQLIFTQYDLFNSTTCKNLTQFEPYLQNL